MLVDKNCLPNLLILKTCECLEVKAFPERNSGFLSLDLLQSCGWDFKWPRGALTAITVFVFCFFNNNLNMVNCMSSISFFYRFVSGISTSENYTPKASY